MSFMKGEEPLLHCEALCNAGNVGVFQGVRLLDTQTNGSLGDQPLVVGGCMRVVTWCVRSYRPNMEAGSSVQKLKPYNLSLVCHYVI
jgi:hypothetical protein